MNFIIIVIITANLSSFSGNTKMAFEASREVYHIALRNLLKKGSDPLLFHDKCLLGGNLDSRLYHKFDTNEIDRFGEILDSYMFGGIT